MSASLESRVLTAVHGPRPGATGPDTAHGTGKAEILNPARLQDLATSSAMGCPQPYTPGPAYVPKRHVREVCAEPTEAPGLTASVNQIG